MHVVNTDGESGTMQRSVVTNHQRQIELLGTLLGDANANETLAMRCHEVDVLLRTQFGGTDQVSFVLTVFVIHDDDAPSGTESFDGRLNTTEHEGGFLGHF
jgi:hypothetical protein